MIYLVDGTPGGGKSYWATRWIDDAMQKGLPVATNVPLAGDWAEKLARGNPLRRFNRRAIAKRAAEYRRLVFESRDLDELLRVRVSGHGEGRWRLIIDEGHRTLNSRMWADGDRAARIAWFSAHRHYGADVAILSQNIEMVDKQIRHLVEFRVRTRNLAKVKKLGVSVTLGRPYFVAVHELHGSPNREIVKRELYGLNRLVRSIYHTHGLAAEDLADDDPLAIWLPEVQGAAGGPAHAGPAAPEAAGAGGTGSLPGGARA